VEQGADDEKKERWRIRLKELKLEMYAPSVTLMLSEEDRKRKRAEEEAEAKKAEEKKALDEETRKRKEEEAAEGGEGGSDGEGGEGSDGEGAAAKAKAKEEEEDSIPVENVRWLWDSGAGWALFPDEVSLELEQVPTYPPAHSTTRIFLNLPGAGQARRQARVQPACSRPPLRLHPRRHGHGAKVRGRLRPAHPQARARRPGCHQCAVGDYEQVG
jgi:hypothetical protein